MSAVIVHRALKLGRSCSFSPKLCFPCSPVKKKIKFLIELMAPRNKITLPIPLVSDYNHVTKLMVNEM